MIRTLGMVALCVGSTLAFPAPEDDATSLVRSVNMADGVSRDEADRIARAYFLVHVGCGAYSGISESTGAWVVEGRFGYAGQPIRGFLINKRTGAIKSPVGPSYARPTHMLRSVPEQPRFR